MSIRKSHSTGRARSASLQVVPEDISEAMEISPQLPTPQETPQPESQPLEPVLSDSLFSIADMTMESNDSGVGRARTAKSGNPLFTVVDRSGIFDMELIFCVCSDGGNIDAQLLQAGLFPATFKQIETLFTVSVLEDFLTDNLECKTTAQQYYSKLQIMTSKMFPNRIPVCLRSIFICTYTKWL
jgi:hypothetical protein